MADNNPFAAFQTMDWAKQLTSMWTDAMPKGLSGGNAEMAERVRSLSRETIAFVEDRVKKDLETARKLADAKGPADLARIQMEYFQGLVADYNRQAMKVAEDAGKAMTTGWGRMGGPGGTGSGV